MQEKTGIFSEKRLLFSSFFRSSLTFGAKRDKIEKNT
jgi:hypothetical protein